MPAIREHNAQDTKFGNNSSDAPPDDTEHFADVPTSYPLCAENSVFSVDSNLQDANHVVASTSFLPQISQTESSLMTTQARSSHNKRRDASYIPRPPNAFILFRSSFIRSQQVTGRVEGNHSNLSKIIGLYWNSLPKVERDEWEAKASIAQADHRKRYPDWRFRHGATTVDQIKSQDKIPKTRRRRVQETRVHVDRDGDVTGEGGPVKDGKISERARGRPSTSYKSKSREKENSLKAREEERFAKIAKLLGEGKKGVELEAAVQDWERGNDVSQPPMERVSPEAGPSGLNKKSESTPFSVAVFSSQVSQVPSESPSTSTSARASPIHLLASSGSSWPATPVIRFADRQTGSSTRSNYCHKQDEEDDPRKSSEGFSPSSLRQSPQQDIIVLEGEPYRGRDRYPVWWEKKYFDAKVRSEEPIEYIEPLREGSFHFKDHIRDAKKPATASYETSTASLDSYSSGVEQSAFEWRHQRDTSKEVNADSATLQSGASTFTVHDNPIIHDSSSRLYTNYEDHSLPQNPRISRFSSLAGWDGETKSNDTGTVTSSFVGGPQTSLARGEGSKESAWQSDPWGQVQSLGLLGGSGNWLNNMSDDNGLEELKE